MAVPTQPGALPLTTLRGDELVALAGVGQEWQLASVDQIAAGGAARHGTFVMTGATPVTVANANISANSVVLFGLKTVGGTVGGAPNLVTVTPGVGFTVAGTALDTSTYNYYIIG